VKNLVLHLIIGILGLWLAQALIAEVRFEGPTQIFIFCGLILGLINFFIKPILKIITLPLRILFWGLTGLLINMMTIWVVDIFFVELIIPGIIPLFWTTLVIWGLNLLFLIFTGRKMSS